MLNIFIFFIIFFFYLTYLYYMSNGFTYFSICTITHYIHHNIFYFYHIFWLLSLNCFRCEYKTKDLYKYIAYKWSVYMLYHIYSNLFFLYSDIFVQNLFHICSYENCFEQIHIKTLYRAFTNYLYFPYQFAIHTLFCFEIVSRKLLQDCPAPWTQDGNLLCSGFPGTDGPS